MSISDRLDKIEARCDAATVAVNEYLGDTIYACSRDYSAWGHGTMGLDDFTLASDDLDIAESLVDATANAHVPALVAALRAVLDLHKPMTMYEHEDCCENDSDDHREERHAEDVVHGGEYFCMDLPTGIVLCAECSRDLDFDGRDYPCPTVRAVTAALGEDAQ